MKIPRNVSFTPIYTDWDIFSRIVYPIPPRRQLLPNSKTQKRTIDFNRSKDRKQGYVPFVALRYIHTRILFYSVVGGLAANSQYKTSKEPTSRATVAHVVKKRETRYDKEKARLKVVLFCRSLLLLPSFEVGKNFKRLLCSSSSPFFAIMPRQQSAAAFMKSFQSSWLFSVKFENNTQTISSFMKFFNRLSLLFSKASLPPLAWLYNFEGNFSKEFSWKVVIQCGRCCRRRSFSTRWHAISTFFCYFLSFAFEMDFVWRNIVNIHFPFQCYSCDALIPKS